MGVSNPNIFSCTEGAHRWLPGNSNVQKAFCDMGHIYYYNGCDELIGKNLLLYPNNRHAAINCFDIFFLFSLIYLVMWSLGRICICQKPDQQMAQSTWNLDDPVKTDKVIYTYNAMIIWEPENKPNKTSKSRSLKLEKKYLHVNWAYENNKRRVRRKRGNLLRGQGNQQLEGVCNLLEYGYQQQQFCKIPRFCIPVLLNESSTPFSWADLLQVRNGRVNCRVRERGRACSWIWVFIRIRRIGWFADMGFCTSFLSKLCCFYHIAPNWSLCFFYKKKIVPFAIVRFRSQRFFISISSSYNYFQLVWHIVFVMSK